MGRRLRPARGRGLRTLSQLRLPCPPTQPVREVVKPDNQLPLTETELNVEVTNSLTANNPGAPKNIARFNFKERCYKFEPMVDQARAGAFYHAYLVAASPSRTNNCFPPPHERRAAGSALTPSPRAVRC